MFKCGEKFTIKNCSIDVEIIGYFPKSQSKDGKDYYVATLNGEKMKIASSFIEMLKKAEVKEEKKESTEVKVQEIASETETEKAVEEKPKKERKNGRRK
ncbi:MAG: hypothetical protein J6S85_22565 [Methanobrevibacter sp.]|nr:hypothetical protein [Methanobrevibacter sp.]